MPDTNAVHSAQISALEIKPPALTAMELMEMIERNIAIIHLPSHLASPVQRESACGIISVAAEMLQERIRDA